MVDEKTSAKCEVQQDYFNNRSRRASESPNYESNYRLGPGIYVYESTMNGFKRSDGDETLYPLHRFLPRSRLFRISTSTQARWSSRSCALSGSPPTFASLRQRSPGTSWAGLTSSLRMRRASGISSGRRNSRNPSVAFVVAFVHMPFALSSACFCVSKSFVVRLSKFLREVLGLGMTPPKM